jgi:hypothetical protein
VIPVTMDAGRRENRGQAVEELESGEAQGGTAGGIGLGEQVEDLVGTTVDEMKAVEGEGSPGTIADQALESGPVGSLDADAGVQAKTATVIPAEHILGLVGFQEAVAPEVAEHSTSHEVLEALQEFVGEAGGFVESEAGFWIG